MHVAATPPAIAKSPPTTRSPFGSDASACSRSEAPPLVPVPIADHTAPFQRATLFAAMPPAVVNRPAATTSPLGSVISALTSPVKAGPVPVPSGDHELPFQRAMLIAATPPAVANKPPATTSPLGRVVSALTDSKKLQAIPVP